MVYGREIDGKVTTFGTTGYTHHRVFVLYDRATESVWYPRTGKHINAIGGPLQKQTIPILENPKVMTLGKWRKLYPDTLVLLKDKSAV